MGAFQVFSCLVLALVAIGRSDKNSFFDTAIDQRVEVGVLNTSTAFSARYCTATCLKSAACMACNWHEATRTCELLGAHATPVAAPGYTALTRFCKVTELGVEFQGSLSVTKSGRACQHWESNCDPHCHEQPEHSFHAGVFPENYCRNPDQTPQGPWCFTTDPNTKREYCPVPFC